MPRIHQSGRTLVNPPRFKYKRPPNVHVIDVVGCESCGAEVNEKCRNSGGLDTASHGIRRRMAVRIHNEQRGI